ncbi:2OG-Fe(II) oxygenase [Phlyctema vagabunda]|uniref:2OG-Fe(II) oxygenase n=1 Tax=Phlyctema vagabunda TaxID=108571 RepID=A0ABR4P2Y1_9HELO
MAEVLNAPAVLPTTNDQKDEYVYFHSGSEATYRKVVPKDQQTSFTSIPTIDIARIDDPSLEVRKQIAREIFQACSTCGFFYVKNHGIPDELIRDTFEVIKSFFAEDIEVKMDAHSQKNPAIRGYEPMFYTKLDPTTTGDFKEAFTMGDCVIEPEQDYVGKVGRAPPTHITKPQNIWPSKAPYFREGVYQYYNAVLPLAMKLVRIFALAFELDETAFDQYFEFPITGMRPLHYPPMPPETGAEGIGLGAHADFSCKFSQASVSRLSLIYSTGLTLVLQDTVPALEVLNQDGLWVNADPQPGTLVCNVGQYLERQSNGKFQATVHRVRNKTGERRYSLPFFLTMDPDVQLNVLEQCVADGEDPKYEPINVGELYIRRVLPARVKHPTSIKYRDVPQEDWKYDFLLS